MAVHEIELAALAQTGEQRRPAPGKDRLHKELVLIDQSQICQRQAERHATQDCRHHDLIALCESWKARSGTARSPRNVHQSLRVRPRAVESCRA